MNVKKTYIALPVILLGFVLSAVQQAQGELKTETISGKISGDEITFDIYLPEGYRKEGVGYPVIYNLHGPRRFLQKWWDISCRHEKSNCR